MTETGQNSSDTSSSLYEQEQIRLALDSHAIVSIADIRGNIIHVNDKFCAISGYSRDELLGQNHRIIKSERHSADFYNAMWSTIASGEIWHGELCNKRKDGSHYWVASTITPFLDEKGKPYQYVSIRTDITALKENEAALQRSHADLLATLEATADGILAIDENCHVSFANKQFYDMWEIPDELQGPQVDDKKLIESVLDKLVDPDAFCEKVEALYQSIESSIDMLEMRDERVFERSSYPLLKENKPVGRVWGFRDITDRIQDRKEIERHKERLRLGQLFANIGTWEWDIPSGNLFWTERIAPLFGYKQGEVETSYENFLAAVHPDDRQAVIDAVNACVEDDVPYEIEHRVIWQDGTVRWLLERGAVVRDDNGNPMTMTGVVQDIHDRKLAELAVQESERQLREAQQISHIGSWEANKLTGELKWSDEIYRIFGYEPGSIEPTVEFFKSTVHPEDREKVELSEERSRETGKHDVVHRIVLPDNTVRYVHELAQSETDDNGNLVRLAGTVQDISDDIEAQQALIAARDEAERANRAKSEFLSRMSHELRTPLNAILGFAQLMDADTELGMDNKDSVKEIMQAGKHLLELINEVLDLAKIESGHIDLSVEAIDICPLVNDCISLITPLAEKRDISLKQECKQKTITRADPIRFKQAVLNLLSNAIKYNRHGGFVKVHSEINNEGQLRLLVTDSGPGIAEENIDQLFLPFNRLNAENTEIEGSGIGLTLTKRLVEMMGGSVGVKSEPGVGSTFWIDLPIETIIENDKTGINTGLPTQGGASDSEQEQLAPKNTILYIEDNPANLRLVTMMLARRKNIHLITAHTPSLGLELAMARNPSLILLDINLPGMDGYQVLDTLKTEVQFKDTPVLAVSSNAMPEDIARGLKAGFDKYITKPIDITDFFAAIDEYLLDTL